MFDTLGFRRYEWKCNDLNAPSKRAALRLGWRVNDDIANVSAGLGWRIGRASVDYAWVPSKLDLEDTHRFSFGAQF